MKTSKAFFSSQNIMFVIIAILMVIFGVTFSDQAAKDIVAGVVAILAAGNILIHYFRDLQTRPSFKDILKNPMFWGSVLAFLVGFLPWLPIKEIQSLIDAILSGNTTLILQAGIALVLVVLKLVKKPTAPVS
jgi:predicted permease